MQFFSLECLKRGKKRERKKEEENKMFATVVKNDHRVADKIHSTPKKGRMIQERSRGSFLTIPIRPARLSITI